MASRHVKAADAALFGESLCCRAIPAFRVESGDDATKVGAAHHCERSTDVEIGNGPRVSGNDTG